MADLDTLISQAEALLNAGLEAPTTADVVQVVLDHAKRAGQTRTAVLLLAVMSATTDGDTEGIARALNEPLDHQPNRSRRRQRIGRVS